jgi:arylsulfatase A-like enzyme
MPLTLLLLLAGSCGAADNEPPNFILILTDDQGWVQTSTQMDPDDPETKSDYLKATTSARRIWMHCSTQA